MKKRTMMYRVVGGGMVVIDGQAECLADQMFGRCSWIGKWSDH